GHTGQQLAMVADFPALSDAAFHQQRRADVAIAIATALRAFIAKALRCIEDAFARPDIEHGAGGLQGNFHMHVIIERDKPAKAPGRLRPTSSVMSVDTQLRPEFIDPLLYRRVLNNGPT